MQQFLEYSRQLSIDEMEMVAALDPKAPKRSPPRMEQFREQIDLYEGLYLEIEEMKSSKVFCVWFRVDLRPFKQSLLNTVCKWSSMFKKHLVERVTTSLSDLGAFIRFVSPPSPSSPYSMTCKLEFHCIVSHYFYCFIYCTVLNVICDK